MDDTYKKALSIFYPSYLKRIEDMDQPGMRFVQYTSADAAMSIIQNKEIWLRNVQCMNDYREVGHGIDCLVHAFRNTNEGARFKAAIESLFPGVINEIGGLFDGWIPHLRSSTYIACVSEHPNDENSYGRLSMWRAYGGKRSVAVVMNTTAFRSETDALSAYTLPVAYQDPEQFNIEFGELADRIEEEKDFVSGLGQDAIMGYLFELFKTYALCIKHPGFSEEREWRVVYNPVLKESKYVDSSIESINGIPQEIHKIQLKNIPEGNFNGATIPELIDRIIIGPNDHQQVLGKTFIKLLEEAGCKNAMEKIRYSGIPPTFTMNKQRVAHPIILVKDVLTGWLEATDQPISDSIKTIF
jgi:hypothetical protein